MAQCGTGWSELRQRPWLWWCCLMAVLLDLLDAEACVDTTEEQDSGGDNCTFYDDKPEFCGCCDTSSFHAATACCSCQSPPDGTAAWWTTVFHTWPRKAVKLHLERKGLHGELPSDFGDRWPNLVEINLKMNQLTGGLPASLGQLVNLKHLDLQRNQLTGSVPPELGNLSNVTFMDLQSNQLNGTIPPELGRLSNLWWLELSFNSFTGGIPAELGLLSKLGVLALSDNYDLGGGIPAELGQLSNLQMLLIIHTSLVGTIPEELGGLSNLEYLQLQLNKLQGSIPATLGNLSKLKLLRLDGNQLSGSVPAELGKLSDLKILDLRRNELSSVSGGLGQLSNLEELHLSFNRLSSLPEELGKLSNLRLLYLDANQLNGTIITSLEQLSSLQVLNLRHNRLSGGIPTGVAHLSSLHRLLLSHNRLNGSLMEGVELESMSNLAALDLGSNQFGGTIPADLQKLPNLGTLDIHDNQLSGSIPAELGNLTRLRTLTLFGNRLSGAIPAELGQMPALMFLDLNNNQLSGNIPAELGKARFLFELKLAGNNLNGTIPPELGQLSYLHELQLQGNQLSGSIPAELGQLPYLNLLDLQGNQLNGTIPSELGNLQRLGWLDVNRNHLTGSIPKELGDLPYLQQLSLKSNQLRGSIPAELGKLSRLQELDLSENHLSGLLPPALGQLSQLRVLNLAKNQLGGGGLPPSYSGMSRLAVLNLERNTELCGSTDAVSELPNLLDLRLRGCCFESISLPPGLQYLDLGENNLALVPDSLRTLRSLRTLLLDRNRIGHWDTTQVAPVTWYTPEGTPFCGWKVPGTTRLQWPQLERLDLSGNQLGTPLYEFLASLSHVPQLATLQAADNHLSGGLPTISHNFVHSFVQNSWFDDCIGLPVLSVAFPSLLTLDLSRNNITAVLSAPPPQLVRLDLSGNRLTEAGLGEQWWRSNSVALIDVQDNPALRLPVLLHPDRSCPEAQVGGDLMANPQAWTRTSAGNDCTSLCPRRPQVILDVSAREEALCRCGDGQGTGLTNCTDCQDDTFSVQSFNEGAGHHQRTCHPCPKHSELRGFAGQCFADCRCIAGYFMQKLSNGTPTELGPTSCTQLLAEAQVVTMQGNCQPCDMWRTSKPGSRTEEDCVCNGDPSKGGWEGLIQKGTECRCPEGKRINFAQRRCVFCELAEVCSESRSLEPPEVRVGFWATPPPPPGDDGTFGNFSSHSIWRCDSPEACPGNFSCGWNRAGTACSLCEQGFFRTPGGRCTRCPQNHQDTRLTLLGFLVACMIFPLLAHGLLSADSSTIGLVLTLRSFRISLKQLLKFAQILGVVSLFQVQWPDIVLSVFQVFRALSFDFASWAGVACLDAQQQQTVALELAFRWMLPVLGAAVTTLSAVLATSCGLLCPRRRGKGLVGRILNFRVWDILRVLLFFLQLFYPSLLKNALLPLTCAPSPNGHLTMNMFPHAICWDLEEDASFWPLALVGGLFTILLIAGYPLLLCRLRRKRVQQAVAEAEAEAEAEAKAEAAAETTETGAKTGAGSGSVVAHWWAFALEDFRPDRTGYALVVVGKDVVLNLTTVVLPGLGTAQLLLTAMVSAAYAALIFTAKPYYDTSNTLLEACTSVTVATLCVFSAGMGFQSEPGVLDISSYLNDGRKNPAYLQRALSLVGLQGLSLFVPAAIITYQVLSAFERTRRCIPPALLPSTPEQRETWRKEIQLAPFFVRQLDDVALNSLYHVIKSSHAARSTLQRASTKISLQSGMPGAVPDQGAAGAEGAAGAGGATTAEPEHACGQGAAAPEEQRAAQGASDQAAGRHASEAAKEQQKERQQSQPATKLQAGAGAGAGEAPAKEALQSLDRVSL